jgi:hypothetical protein
LKPSGRGQLTGALLGLATGMGTSVLSDHARFAEVAGVFVMAAVLMATSRLRQRPRAPLTLLATRSLLTSALAVGVVSLVGPRSWAGSAALGATALAVTAVLIPAPLSTALRLLGGVGAVGAGTACVVGRTARDRGRDMAQEPAIVDRELRRTSTTAYPVRR